MDCSIPLPADIGHSGNLLISLYTNHRVKLLICLSTESLTVSVDTPTNTSLVVVEFGDTVSIDCIASTTGVDIDYEWMKVNNLTTGDSVIVSTNQTLFVSFLTSSEEAGYYYCRATISPTLMDVFNVSEVVLVIFAPTFVMHPSSMLTSMDMTIQLQCMATGFPQPDIEWIRLDSNNNTVDLPSFSNITYTGSTSILTIDPVETDDFGSYRCITTPPTSLPGNLSALSSFNVSLGSGSGSGMQSLYTTLTPVLGSDLTDSSLENLTASSMIAVLTGERMGIVSECMGMYYCNTVCVLSLLQYLLLLY